VKPQFHLVLVHPEIPGNTGSLGRTTLSLNAELVLIHPLAFSLDEKSVRRAGLDYWKHVTLAEFNSFDEFLLERKPAPERLFFFSKNAKQSLYEAQFQQGDYLIFGSESKGLPTRFFQDYPERFYSLPILSPHVRSLNLANAATAVSYEFHRQMLTLSKT
jgi:tRNA (cytidine/uridine-2'-O-)-methyltransferase